ncbi:MAG: tetratricopeptide repeat protein [Flavisolibacter sp.]
MRKLMLLCGFIVYLSSSGQDLKNTEWIKIKVEREDGSTLIDRKESAEDPLQYFFLSDSVHFSSNHQYSVELKYNLKGSVLSIGDFAKYNVDSLDDKFLIISQLNESMPKNRLNRYYFINSEYLFDYLQRNQKMHLVNDSQVECNDHMCPTFTGSMFDLFSSEKFRPVDKNRFVYGYFIVDPIGHVTKCVVDSSKNFSQNEIKKISELVSSTSGSWIVPPAPIPVQFKIKFAFKIDPLFISRRAALDQPLYATEFDFFPGQRKNTLSVDEQRQADDYINEGIRLFEKQNYEKAALEFEHCISIDSLCIDAYYNLAYTYQKLGKNELACEIWKKLSDMNQKQGETLYHQFCK